MRLNTAALTAGAIALMAGLTIAGPVPARKAPTKATPVPNEPAPDSPAPTKSAAEARPFAMRAQTQTPTQIFELSNQNARGEEHSAARIWNEMLLFAIRHDLARPTVHARNLYHISAAMYDSWAAYDAVADQVIHQEKLVSANPDADRAATIAYATYRLMQHRFQFSVGVFDIFPELDNLMNALGYDPFYFNDTGDDPRALGNRIAQTYIAYGLQDGSNEANGYMNEFYEPLNPPLAVEEPGNPDIIDPDRWQPLALSDFVDQNGNPIPGGFPPFLSPEWGEVLGFSMRDSDLQILNRDGHNWKVWHNPGPPPMHDDPSDLYRWGFEMVSTWSSHLDPTDGVMWDVSPNAIGNTIPLPGIGGEMSFYNRVTGEHGSQGYAVNPVTGQPYPLQIVPRGDYTRILAEFWADGPASETPPGHWFTILNYVIDHPDFERRFMGEGPIVDPLEFDVKSYLAMGGAMHDVAIACWSVKGYYDYVRPVSAIRYLADQGQCSDPSAASYNPDGIHLIADLIEVVTHATTGPGGKHEHLAGNEGKIAIKAWRGPDAIIDPNIDTAGVGWILAENWWPYQRPNFVTPPFAGYMSGHSTYSRAAAELMTLLTGSEWFPGGLGEFIAPQNEFLVFEEGPTMDVHLQWASYRDASDQCSLSRMWGGIHPPADDIPGRYVGMVIGPEALHEARRYFNGQKSCPADYTADGLVNFDDVTAYIAAFTARDEIADMAAPWRTLNFFDLAEFINQWSAGCP